MSGIIVRGPVAIPVSGWTQRASDGFTAHTSGNLTQDATWTAVQGTINYDGSGKVAPAGATLDIYSYTAVSFNGAQYSQATIASGGGGTYTPGVCVRAQATTTCYYLFHNNGTLTLGKDNAGTTATLNSVARTPVAGNKLRLEAVGTGSATQLTAYEDVGSGFVAVWSNIDPGGTYIDNGKPGIFFNGAFNGFDLTTWSGGDQ